MTEKYDLSKMLKEIKEDSKITKIIDKKWASQEDIKEMLELKKKEKIK